MQQSPSCGHLNAELTLTDRTYVCTQCGMVKDRDRNAADNLDMVGRAHPEPTDACGLDGSVSTATLTQPARMKQEAKEVQ